MKSEVISTQESRCIDWSKVMLVKLTTSIEGDKIVLTSGKHSDSAKTFCGTLIVDTVSQISEVGEYSANWSKFFFTPILGPLSILFTND